MDYRAKLLALSSDLNEIGSDGILFPDYKIRRGKFVMKIEEGLIKNRDGVIEDAISVEFIYKEKDLMYLMYQRRSKSMDVFAQAYFEIMRYGILGVDNISNRGGPIMLTWKTLMTEGLIKYKNKI